MGHSCGNCASKESLFVQGIRTVFHVLGIRFFVKTSTFFAVCANCKTTLMKEQMPPELKCSATFLIADNRRVIYRPVFLLLLQTLTLWPL